MTNSFIDRLLTRFIKLNQKFWLLFVCTSVALTIVGLYFAKHIELDTDLSRLLPQQSEAVQNLTVIQGKAGGSNDLRLVMEGGPLEIRLKAAAEFVELLQKNSEIRSAKFKTPKAFLEKFKYHLVPIESLNAIHKRVREEQKKYGDFFDPLGLESEGEKTPDQATTPEEEKEELNHAKDLLNQLDAMQPFYQTKDGNYLAIRVTPAVENFSIETNRQILNHFRDSVEQFNFKRFHPDIKTEIYGSIPEHIARYDSISADLSFGGWGIFLILLVVAVYFRNLWALLILIPPLVAGLSIGLAATFFFEHTLNSITVFLILVVFGMGIEFGIHLWARFLEERKTRPIFESLLKTWEGTGRATVTSTFALFAGYALLTLSSFQGFAQFGRVAMILVSSVAFCFLVFMPSWIYLTEKLRGDKIWKESLSGYFENLTNKGGSGLLDWSRYLRISSIFLAITGIVLTLVFIRFDYKFDDSVALPSKPKSQTALDNIFTERLKPSALAVFSNSKDAGQFLSYFESHKKEYPEIPLVSGLGSFLPEDQDKRIEAIKGISEDIEYSWLKKVEDPVVQKTLREIKDRAPTIAPIQMTDLPLEMKEPFIASDKSGDLLVYIYDIGGETDGLKAMKFSDAVKKLEKQSGQDPILSGPEIIFADVVRRVTTEGPWLVFGMLIFVFAICWLDFRRLQDALLTISPVLLGFLITAIVMVLSKVQINFYNMIAIASLGSMVVDNSIHLYHSFLENKSAGYPAPASRAALFVSPTIIVCTTTSILGYGGMLLANHKGVASLGYVAVVGLLCCLISSIVFFPAWLKLFNNQSLNASPSDLSADTQYKKSDNL